MLEFISAGNWKLNKTPNEAKQFFLDLIEKSSPGERQGLVVLPPALVTSQVAESTVNSGIRWGGQNCYFENQGAFTGENSAQVLHEMGADFCLVGHSERRQIFGETDEMLAKKMKAVQTAGMIPILCVGETVDQRKAGQTNKIIGEQVLKALSLADENKKIWLAYEPVWAIGTGLVATPEQVSDAHSFLRETLKKWGTERGLSDFATSVPILYGGSVKPENASDLAKLPNVNGFLIGGASLKVDDFLKIHRSAISR